MIPLTSTTTFWPCDLSPVISLTPATSSAYGSDPLPWQTVHATTLAPLHSTHGWLLEICSLRFPVYIHDGWPQR